MFREEGIYVDFFRYVDFTNSENGKSKEEEKSGGNNNEGLSDD